MSAYLGAKPGVGWLKRWSGRAGVQRKQPWFLWGFRPRKCVLVLALYSLTFQLEAKFLEAGS